MQPFLPDTTIQYSALSSARLDERVVNLIMCWILVVFLLRANQNMQNIFIYSERSLEVTSPNLKFSDGMIDSTKAKMRSPQWRS